LSCIGEVSTATCRRNSTRHRVELRRYKRAFSLCVIICSIQTFTLPSHGIYKPAYSELVQAWKYEVLWHEGHIA